MTEKYSLRRIKYPTDMDVRCRLSCDILNSIPGVITAESCSGHGLDSAHILFQCVHMKTLNRLVRTVGRIRYEVKEEYDPRIHNWITRCHYHKNLDKVMFLIAYDLGYLEEKERVNRIKGKIAWRCLNEALMNDFIDGYDEETSEELLRIEEQKINMDLDEDI